ncbi:5-oxoprolinase subunit PxpA [Vibrio quintilis]|uniref:LamB/YcsF family protein n=1 Tax=Vibrio quintilis TaxID=1117707 RepID=A0A1M7YW43_9VIBR|nr:5-oxoprolinase subunit PxpA [Vibrio quintilis]SHO56899.1 LamB/YcsF family protein [Vibrio quintilis]
MKLNCDMGESFGPWEKGCDAEVMPWIDMANIACGFHASDPLTMDKTVKLAKQAGVSVGAHPGYPDLLGFGRRVLQCSDDELRAWIIYQIGALQGICRSHDMTVDYVKPHGALYNTMMKDEAVLKTVMQATLTALPGCPLMVMATPQHFQVKAMADQIGLPVLFEAFSDRAYDDEGYLTDRRIAGAVYHDPDTIIQQIRQIQREGTVTTINGKTLAVHADTICVHGDGEHALTVVSAVSNRQKSGDNHAD